MDEMVLVVFLLEFTLLLIGVIPVLYKIYMLFRARNIQPILPTYAPPAKKPLMINQGTQTDLCFPMNLGPPYDPGPIPATNLNDEPVEYIDLDTLYMNCRVPISCN